MIERRRTILENEKRAIRRQHTHIHTQENSHRRINRSTTKTTKRWRPWWLDAERFVRRAQNMQYGDDDNQHYAAAADDNEDDETVVGNVGEKSLSHSFIWFHLFQRFVCVWVCGQNQRKIIISDAIYESMLLLLLPEWINIHFTPPWPQVIDYTSHSTTHTTRITWRFTIFAYNDRRSIRKRWDKRTFRFAIYNAHEAINVQQIKLNWISDLIEMPNFNIIRAILAGTSDFGAAFECTTGDEKRPLVSVRHIKDNARNALIYFEQKKNQMKKWKRKSQNKRRKKKTRNRLKADRSSHNAVEWEMQSFQHFTISFRPQGGIRGS